MGFGNDGPNVTQVDNTNPLVQGTGQAAGGFFQDLFSSGANPFAGASNLGQQGNTFSTLAGQNPLGQTQQILNQSLAGPQVQAQQGSPFSGGGPAAFNVSPQATNIAVNNVAPDVSGVLGGQIPNVDVGSGIGTGQALITALEPSRQAAQARAFGNLQNTAGSVFNTAFGQQGIDLASNLANAESAQNAQILQQGQQVDLQQALANQQGAIAQGQLGLGTGSLLNDIAQNAFGQNLAGAQFGLNQNQQNFAQNLAGAQFGLGQNAQNFDQALQAAGFNQGVMNDYFTNALNAQQANFGNILNAGQLGLQGYGAQTNALASLLGLQNQANQISINPYVSLLGQGVGFAGQGISPLDTISQPQSGGLGSFLGTLGGGLLGSIAGPFGATVGANLGSGLFGGNNNNIIPGVTPLSP